MYGAGPYTRRATVFDPGIRDSLLSAWRTNARVTEELIQSVPRPLFAAQIPGSPRRTVCMLAGHLHNARCMWLRTLARPHGLAVPASVDRRSVTRQALLRALRRSAGGILHLLEFGCDHGGRIPPTSAYVWRNLALDVGHVLTYFVAHEAHHRGQLVLIAHQLGVPLPPAARNALWQWKPPRSRSLARRR
jgi:uncharacterized damage-inducible protein DinB